MRIVALLCGIAAGVLVFILPRQLGIDLLPSFLRLWKNSDTQQLVARIIFYASPVVAMLGGFLALFLPNIAALLMLAAAVGWVGILLAVPQLFALAGAAPSGLALLGAILAYAAGEAEAARRRAERRRVRSINPQPFRNEADYEPGDEREAGLRRDPLVGEPRTQQRPRYEIPLTLEDSKSTRPSSPAMAPPQGAAPQVQVAAPTAAPVARATLEEPTSGRNRASMRSAEAARASLRSIDDDDFEPAPKSRIPLFFVVFNGVAVVILGLVVGVLLMGRGSFPMLGNLLGSATSTEQASPAPDGGAAVAPQGGTEQSYADLFAYCSAVGTLDFVDRRYTGPVVPPVVTEALGIPQSTSQDRVHWRCSEGRVLACTSYGWPACDTTPTAAEMLDFCKLNPDIPRLLAPNGTWSCEKGKPKLPADASWPVDQRGFFPKAWVVIVQAAG